MKKNRVTLSQGERQALGNLPKAGTLALRKLQRTRILLLSAEGPWGSGKPNEAIADLVETSAVTISRIGKRYVEEGLEAARNEKPKSGVPRTFDGHVRGQITALACSDPPEGQAQWSLRRLAEKMVALEYVAHISDMTIQEVLKKTT